MQASRVNGLTSGVFAFLVPASCLNQKGSDTRRDNTTFPIAESLPPLARSDIGCLEIQGPT
ncbi:hypothetical protein RX33_04433 [Escherichia coli]|nr:hypothetical protein [Escherichia coli]OYC53749.1 hypothetical protein RX33_04433 [Escherichia coli]